MKKMCYNQKLIGSQDICYDKHMMLGESKKEEEKRSQIFCGSLQFQVHTQITDFNIQGGVVCNFNRTSHLRNKEVLLLQEPFDGGLVSN